MFAGAKATPALVHFGYTPNRPPPRWFIIGLLTNQNEPICMM
jgi:hypothetical protein